ncbi:MAG: hypothetical protein ABIH76_00230 [Candidatus Bathyarchaeota archaeon]
MATCPKSALQLLNEEIRAPKLFTGFGDLDLLMGGGIKPGLFYLLYGDENSGLDVLVNRILVNSLLPQEKHGFGGKVLYVNCGNYSHEQTLLNIELLWKLIKSANLDPMEALEKINAICAFSAEQEEQIADEISGMIKNDEKVKIVVVRNIAKLFVDKEHSQDKNLTRKIPVLDKIIEKILQACSERNIAFVASCRPHKLTRTRIPLPEGGSYLTHKAGVMVYLRKIGQTPQFQAFLLKHPHKPKESSIFALIGKG